MDLKVNLALETASFMAYLPRLVKDTWDNQVHQVRWRPDRLSRILPENFLRPFLKLDQQRSYNAAVKVHRLKLVQV